MFVNTPAGGAAQSEVTPSLPATTMYRRILVPIDGSTCSRAGLDEAVKLARLAGARVLIVHVIDELAVATGFESAAVYTSDVLAALRRSGRDLLDKAGARVAEAGVPVETHLLESNGHAIVDRILDLAGELHADLIVIGSHGRRGLSRMFMGSDAEHMVRRSPLPVLLVRQPPPAAPA